jgi:hypothetical protein
MTLKNLRAGQTIDHTDFLARVDMLGALGKTVMISNYTRFDRVTSYLRSSTRNWIAMVVGIPTLREIFEDKYYTELDGGLLEGLGKLFQASVKLLVYPTLGSATEELATAESLEVRAEYQSLYSYFLQIAILSRSATSILLNCMSRRVMFFKSCNPLSPTGRHSFQCKSHLSSRSVACLGTPMAKRRLESVR